MAAEPAPQLAERIDDVELVRRARAREGTAFRTIMERNNRRLYRIARSILRNDSEAEDVVQDAYVKAYIHLGEFRGDARLATWLARITMNEALERLRRERPAVALDTLEPEPPPGQLIQFPQIAAQIDPEQTMAQRQILHLVEQTFDKLPEIFRVVFMARVIEGMSVEETAEILGLKQETVKTRLHRARQLLRDQLDRQIGPLFTEAFPFAGKRCEHMTQAVLQRLNISD
jgi:RNA polymerase sigma-70 factor, ECF subfamily